MLIVHMPRSQLSIEASLRLRHKYHLKLLTYWTASFSPCFSCFPKGLICHLCSYIPAKGNSNKLLRLHQGTLQYFKKNHKWALFAPIRRNLLAEGLRLVYIPDEDLAFLCGGLRLQARSAYYVTRTKTRQLPDMSARRSLHGLCYAKSVQAILVFGGEQLRERFEQLRSAEKFDLVDNEWKRIPDMLDTRADSQPCVAGGNVFLCGGNLSGSAEKLCLQTGQYHSLHIRGLRPGPGLCVYLPTDTVLIFAGSTNSRYSLSSGESMPLFGRCATFNQSCPPAYRPRLNGAIAYDASADSVHVIECFGIRTIALL